MAYNQNSGLRLQIPTWLLSIFVVALIGASGAAVTTLANANTDHQDTLPKQQKQIDELTRAVIQIKSDAANTRIDAAATRAITIDTNANVKLLLAAQLASKK